MCLCIENERLSVNHYNRFKIENQQQHVKEQYQIGMYATWFDMI